MLTGPAVVAATDPAAPEIPIGTGGRPTLAYGQAVPAAEGPNGKPVLEWNPAGANHQQPQPYRRHARTFELGPFEEMEFRYRLEKDGGFVYAWTATGKVQVDFHGEPDGRPKGSAEFYDQAERESATGTFCGPGPRHSRRLEYLTSDPIKITLNSAGYFQRGIEFRQSG